MDAERVDARYPASSFAEVVDRAVELLAPHVGRGAGQLHEALTVQSEGTISLGQGVSVLHARIVDLADPVVAIVTTQECLSTGDDDTDIFFALLAPQEDPQRHLHALARVSRLCHDPTALSRMRAAKDASELVRAVAQASPGTERAPFTGEAATGVAVLELEDERSATRMAEVVAIAFSRPLHLTRGRGSAFELFRVVAQADPRHRLLVFPIRLDDAGVVQALLDQQATLYPGTLCKLRLLQAR
jgi:PTS system nitrogen regulatory IIA component